MLCYAMLCIHFVTCYGLISDSETSFAYFIIVRTYRASYDDVFCRASFTCTVMYYSHEEYIIVHVKLVLQSELLFVV